MNKALEEELERTGRLWLREAVGEATLIQLDKLAEIGDRPGVRPDWSNELDRIFGPDSKVCKLVQKTLPAAMPVRLTIFNKSSVPNWAVPWHQDRVIAVKERYELDGFSCWSRKSDHWHVEPPISLLEKMVFIRIHLDSSDQENGALELALGSHKLGAIAAEEATRIAEELGTEICIAARGDVLIVKELTLHRSLSSVSGATRRAIRVDYVVPNLLPDELRWNWRF